MKKIFYWSPYLSNVATIRNVVNSAYSLIKYDKISFRTYILDVFGEWATKRNELYQKKIDYLKISNLKINFVSKLKKINNEKGIDVNK